MSIIKGDPHPATGGIRGARRMKAQDDLAQLGSAIYELREGSAKDQPNAALVAAALERDYARLDAEAFRDLESFIGGTPGAVLARGQSMRSAIGQAGPDVSLGDLVRGLGLGDWRGVNTDVKAMVLSGGAGAAIPGAVTGGIVDLAREKSVVFRAGAQLMPIDSPNAKVARLVSTPAVQWEPEAVDRDLTEGSFGFDAAELAAKTAFLFASYSLEAVEDCINLEETIFNDFSAQLALIFDEAGLAGDGADKPLGLQFMNTAEDRILERLAVGEIADYRPFVRAMGAVKAAHHEPSSVVMTPGLWTELNCLQDTDNNPLQAPRAYGQLSEFVSSFLPANSGVGTNEHTAVVGDLSAMTFGVKTNATIEVSRLGTGFKRGSIEIRGYLRMDMYLTRPDAICVLRGVTLPAA